MANAASIIGSLRGKGGRFRGMMRTLISALLAVIIIAGLVLIWQHYHKRNNTNQPASLAQVENASQHYNNQSLKTNDFHSYQISQVTLAQEYLNNKDTANAERVMNEVFKTVPAGKVDYTSYMVMANIQKTKGDTVQYKHYLALLIDKLKSLGNSSMAAQYQKILDGL